MTATRNRAVSGRYMLSALVEVGWDINTIYTQGSPHSSTCTNETDNLDMVLPDFEYVASGPYYNTAITPAPHMSSPHYPQASNQPLIPDAMFQEMRISPSYFSNIPNSYDGSSSIVDPGLWRYPGAEVQPVAPTPTTPAVNPVITRVDTRVAHNWCDGECEGKFEGAHKCIRGRQSLSVICLEYGCGSILTTRGRFNRHWKTKHLNGGLNARQKLSCPFKGCPRVGDHGFARPDNLRQHRRNVHSEDIPKERRRCKRASSAH